MSTLEKRLIDVPFKYEPKRKNRFYAEFDTDMGIQVWQIKSFERPKLNINKVDINFLDAKNYVAGIYEWGDITIELIDLIGPSTSQSVMEWVRMHTESLTGRMGYAAGYKRNITLKALDPTKIVIEQWTLEQCQIVDVGFGNNDYSDDEIATISLTVQPWRCILNM